MSETYQAVITGDKIRWIVSPPKEIVSGKEIPVEITIRTEEKKNLDKGIAMYNALRNLSKIDGTLSSIKDPSKWQRELRKDRDLKR